MTDFLILNFDAALKELSLKDLQILYLVIDQFQINQNCHWQKSKNQTQNHEIKYFIMCIASDGDHCIDINNYLWVCGIM